VDRLTNLLDSLSGFAWPALALFAIYVFRTQIRSFLSLLSQQLASGAAVKWKDFEFRGLDIRTFDIKGTSAYQQEPADGTLFTNRRAAYELNKNLFLVHRIRPTGEVHETSKLPTYDISVYLISHKNRGHMNEVKEVEYYFGRYFGSSKGEFGTKFVVKNGTDGFAARINAYGPMLCEARLIFHDGTEATVSRYLDFEGTGYRFQPTAKQTDVEDLPKRAGWAG
jgi:hypothetical protein